MNRTMINYPDYNTPLSKAYTDELTTAFSTFSIMTGSDMDRLPSSVEPLEAAYADTPPRKLANIVNMMIESANSWHFEICPLKYINQLEYSVTQTFRNETVLDRAPEMAAPKITEHSTETQEFKMTRFNKGIKMLHDFYKTKSGVEMLAMEMRGMASDILLTAKLAVISALYTCKDVYSSRFNDFPSLKPNYDDQFTQEVASFGILSVQEKGIYMLNTEAKTVMGNAFPKKTPTIAIFAEGDLASIVYNSSYETESYRRGKDASGKDIAQQRLTKGGASMDLGGIKIYEDRPYNISSLGMVGKNMFEKDTQIGRSFTVSCNSYINFPEEKSSDYMDFKSYNVNADDYVRFGVDRMLSGCGRFDDSGALSSLHGQLCDQIGAFCAASGLSAIEGVDGSKYVDPYIFQCRKTGAHKPVVAVGDMEDYYLSKKFIQFFGDAFACRAKSLLREDGVINLDSLVDLADILYNAPLDEKTENYKAAILLMPENHFPNSSSSSWISNNHTGAPTLPFRDPSTGFLYMTEATSGENAVPLVAARNNKTNKIDMYMFAKKPFAEGQWAPYIPEGSSAAVITKKIVLEAGKGTTQVVELIDPNVTYERCASYDKPYGYCDYPSLSYLSQVNSTGTTRGWSPEILQRAQAGISAVNTVCGYSKKLFLDCMSFDANNVPAHLYTGTPSIDSCTSFFHNDVLKGEHQGVLGAEPTDTDDNVSAIKVYPKTSSVLDTTRLAQEGAAVLRYMGDPSATDRAKAVFTGLLLRRLRPQERERVLSEKADYFNTYDDSAVALSVSKLYKIDKHFRSFFTRFLWDWYKGEVTSGMSGASDYKALAQCANLWASMDTALKSSSLDVARLMSQEEVEKVLRQLRGSAGFAEDLPQSVEKGVYEMRSASSDELSLKSMIYESVSDGRLKTALLKELKNVANVSDKKVLCRSMRLSFNPDVYRRLVETAEGADGAFRLVAWPSNPLQPLAPITDWALDASDDAKAKVEFSFPKAGAKSSKYRHEDSIKYSRFTTASSAKKKRVTADEDEPEDTTPTYASAKRLRRGGGQEEWAPRVRVTGISTDRERRQGDTGGASFSADRFRTGGDLTIGSVLDIGRQEWNSSIDDAESRNLSRKNLIDKLAVCMQSPWSTLRRIGAMLMCQTSISKQQYSCWLDEGLPIPESYSYAEPFVTLRMSSAVWLDASPGNGMTAYNNQDMALQFNATNKTWVGHYTVWLASNIHQPNAVYIKNDVAFRGVVRGLDNSICLNSSHFKYSQPREATATGFVFSHGPGLAADQMPSPFWTLSGKLDEKLYKSSSSKTSDSLRWPGDIFYNFKWRFYEMNANSVLSRESWISMANSNHVNEVLSQAKQKNWDPITKSFGTGEYIVKGKGHLKNWEAPSIKSVLNGKAMAKE